MSTDPAGKPLSIRSASLFAEMWSPVIFAVLSFVLIVSLSGPISELFESKAWKVSGLYSSIFDWSAIQTGFAFGVWGFVIGKTDGFVEVIRETRAMERFMSYVKRANISGFILTFTSLPLIVSEPALTKPYTASFVIVAAWFSLFVWSFLSFLRVAYNFGILASVRDRKFDGA